MLYIYIYICIYIYITSFVVAIPFRYFNLQLLESRPYVVRVDPPPIAFRRSSGPLRRRVCFVCDLLFGNDNKYKMPTLSTTQTISNQLRTNSLPKKQRLRQQLSRTQTITCCMLTSYLLCGWYPLKSPVGPRRAR